MASWHKKARKKLLTVSQEDADYLVAAREWNSTDGAQDKLQPNEHCELCGKQNLRHRFEVQNGLNRNRLWVGSACIKKFELNVLDEAGNILEDDAIDRQLRTSLRTAQRTMCLESIQGLAAKSTNRLRREISKRIDAAALPQMQPDTLLWLFQQFQSKNLSHPAQLFKTDLRNTGAKDAIGSMSSDELTLIKPALSRSQWRKRSDYKRAYDRKRQLDQERQRRRKAEIVQRPPPKPKYPVNRHELPNPPATYHPSLPQTLETEPEPQPVHALAYRLTIYDQKSAILYRESLPFVDGYEQIVQSQLRQCPTWYKWVLFNVNSKELLASDLRFIADRRNDFS